MIMGSTFTLMAQDLEARKKQKEKTILLVFTDDITLKYYKNYFRGNKNVILTSFDEMRRKGLVGLRYREYIILNFITSIEEVKDEVEWLLSDLSFNM